MTKAEATKIKACIVERLTFALEQMSDEDLPIIHALAAHVLPAPPPPPPAPHRTKRRKPAARKRR